MKMKNIKVKMQIGDGVFFRPTCGFKSMDAALAYLAILAEKLGIKGDYRVILVEDK